MLLLIVEISYVNITAEVLMMFLCLVFPRGGQVKALFHNVQR